MEQVDGKLSLSRYVLLGNNTFFLFFRLFQLALERMSAMRQLASNMHCNPVGYSKQKKQAVAEALDLLPKREPGPVEVTDGNIFQALMTLIDKLFDAEIDISVFEDQARFWFGTEAFVLFTIDKLVHNLAKHFIMIATDDRATKLYDLFLQQYHDRNALAQENLYRQRADELLTEEENLYRIEFVGLLVLITINFHLHL
jgi:paired amphipathic helix protein Sin3a